jgi:hypothetical protein
MISYSLYLTHYHVSKWILPIVDPFRDVLYAPIFSIFELALILGINIAISTALYYLVEALYLHRKKDKKRDIQSTEKKSHRSFTISISPLFSRISIGIFLFVLLTFLYTGAFRFTQYGWHHGYFSRFDPRSIGTPTVSLFHKDTVRVPIQAQYDNLSVVVMNLWYYQNADVTRSKFDNPARLRFRLLGDDGATVLSETWWNAYDIESESNYPFGFETIADSKGEEYIVELYLENGAPLDHILLNGSHGKIQTVYTDSKENIIKAPYKLLFNRLSYMITHPDSLFMIGFLLLCFALAKKEAIVFLVQNESKRKHT